MRNPFLVALAAIATLALVGCPPAPRTTGYYGPTLPMADVIQAVNANNGSITTIWTDHTFRAWIHDDKKKEHYVDGDGVLLYRRTPEKPDELLLQGSSVIGKIFEIGTSSGPDAQYWVAVVPEVATEWWGYYKNLGKPCSREVPIRPDLVAEVLGVNTIDMDFMKPPVPTMRFNNDARVYMFTFDAPLATQWIVQKEVWYSLDAKLPVKVLLFDPNGRILLRGDLSEHQPLEGGSGQMIATHYDLFFPETKDRLIFNLKGPRLSKRGIPRAGTIQRRPIGDVKEVRIDEDCGD